MHPYAPTEAPLGRGRLEGTQPRIRWWQVVHGVVDGTGQGTQEEQPATGNPQDTEES